MHRLLNRTRSSGTKSQKSISKKKKKDGKREVDDDLSSSPQEEPKIPSDEVNNNVTEETKNSPKKGKEKVSTPSKSKKNKKRDQESKSKLKKGKKGSGTPARQVVDNVLYEEVMLRDAPTKAQATSSYDDTMSVSSQFDTRSMTSQNDMKSSTEQPDIRSVTSQNDRRSMTSQNEDNRSIASQIYDEVARDDFLEEDIYENPDRRSPIARPLPELPPVRLSPQKVESKPRSVSQSSTHSQSRPTSIAEQRPVSSTLLFTYDDVCNAADRKGSASTLSVGSHRSRATTGDSVYERSIIVNPETASLASRKSAGEDIYETADVNFLTDRPRSRVVESAYDDNLTFRTEDTSSLNSSKTRDSAIEDLYETADLSLIAARAESRHEKATNSADETSSTKPQAPNFTEEEDLYETTDPNLLEARVRSRPLDPLNAENDVTSPRPEYRNSTDEDLYETTDLAVIAARLRSGAVVLPSEKSDDEGDIYSHLCSNQEDTGGEYDTLNRELAGAPVEVIYESYDNDTNASKKDDDNDDCYEDVSFSARLTHGEVTTTKNGVDPSAKFEKHTENEVTTSPRGKDDCNDGNTDGLTLEGTQRNLASRETSRDSQEGSNKAVTPESISGRSSNAGQPVQNGESKTKSSPSSNQRAKSEYHNRGNGQVIKPRANTSQVAGDDKPTKPTILSRIKGAHRKKPSTPKKPKREVLKISPSSVEQKQLFARPPSPRIVPESELAKSPLYQSMQQKLNPVTEVLPPR